MIEARVTGDIPPNVQVGDVLELRGTARIVAVRQDIIDVSRFNNGEELIPGGERKVELLITATFEHGVTGVPARPAPPPRPTQPTRTIADSEDRSVRGRTLRPWRR